jgi:hypothetical protein
MELSNSKHDIRLKKILKSDLELIRNWRNSDYVKQFMVFQDFITPQMQEEWYLKVDNAYNFYFIILNQNIPIGLANIKDYFWYGGGGFVMEIPRNWRPKLKDMLGKVTSPLGAFLMGFVVCLFELPCTGGPYIVILGLLANRMTMWASIPILLLYNLVFVLPLIVITLLLYFGFANVENATKWKDNNLRILHLIAGLIMLVLGVLITFGFV